MERTTSASSTPTSAGAPTIVPAAAPSTAPSGADPQAGDASPRGADVPFVPPPLYYVAGLVAGLVLEQVVPTHVPGRPATTVLAVLLVAGGLALVAGGVRGVVRHRTTIVPHHPVSALVVDGAYRWSRNPMYTGLAVAYPGAALLLGSWWPLAAWPLVLLVVTRLVVLREERYLAAAFGDEYAAYRRRVRRWL